MIFLWYKAIILLILMFIIMFIVILHNDQRLRAFKKYFLSSYKLVNVLGVYKEYFSIFTDFWICPTAIHIHRKMRSMIMKMIMKIIMIKILTIVF